MTRMDWKKAHDFAEHAEALGTETDKIMAAMADPEGRSWTVLYTPEGFDSDMPVMSATLWIEPSTGILEVVSTKHLTTVGRWEREVQALMDKAMEGRDE